jgi:chaperonin GroEL (HSP60 family)
LIEGVAFKKTFAYAGFEQQPKEFDNPKILTLNVELELKAEKDNAEVRVENVTVFTTTFSYYHHLKYARTINQSSTQNGLSYMTNSLKLSTLVQKSYFPNYLSEISQLNTLPIVTSFALVEYQIKISSV